jgi:multiple sugar transport system ATP-binding protein
MARFAGKADVVERLGERTLAYVRLSDNSVVVAEDEGQSRSMSATR